MSRGSTFGPQLVTILFIFSILVLPSLSTADMQEPPPMFRAALDRTGEVPGGAPVNNTTLWTFDTDAPVKSSPVVLDGKVLVGTMGGDVLCLDAFMGQIIWTYETEGPVESSPAVWENKVYVGSDDTHVYCLNASDGSLLWRTETGGEIKSSPAVRDGRVYVGSNDFSVRCLDANDGDEVWTFETGGYVYSSPALRDDMVYFGSCDSNVYAVNATSGETVWSYTADFCPASPAVTEDLVIFGAYDGLLHYVNRTTGVQVHSVPVLFAEIYSSAGLFTYEHEGFSDLPMVFVATTAGKMLGIGPDGKEFWNRTHTSGITSSPMVVTDFRKPYDPFIIYGDEGGRLHGIEIENPYVIRPLLYDPPIEWHIELGSNIQSSPFLWHNRTYVGAERADGGGRVVCIGSIDRENEVYVEILRTNLKEGEVRVGFEVHNLEPDSVTVEFEGQVKDADPFYIHMPPLPRDPDGYSATFPATPPEGMKPVIIRVYVDEELVLTHAGQVMCLVEGWNEVVVTIDEPKDGDTGIKGILVASGTVSSNYTIRTVYARWGDGRINCTGTSNWTVALETAGLERGWHILIVRAWDDYRSDTYVIGVHIGEPEETGRDKATDVEPLDIVAVLILAVILVALFHTKPPRVSENASSP